MLLSKLRLSEVAGCSKANISNALKRKQLFATTEGKIDLKDSRNIGWLSNRYGASEAVGLRELIGDIVSAAPTAQNGAAGCKSAPSEDDDDEAGYLARKATWTDPVKGAWPEIDFHDGKGFVPSLAFSLRLDTDEDSWTLSPLPCPVKMVFDGHRWRAFNPLTGFEYQTREAEARA